MIGSGGDRMRDSMREIMEENHNNSSHNRMEIDCASIVLEETGNKDIKN